MNFRVLAIVASVLPLICGCGAQTDLVPVSGQVVIDDQPLTFGQLTVYPEGRRPSFGKLDSEGRFTLTSFELGDGVPIGQHIATITAVEGVGENARRWFAPKKYSDKATGVWVTIDGPTDDLKVDLTWAGSNQIGPYVESF